MLDYKALQNAIKTSIAGIIAAILYLYYQLPFGVLMVRGVLYVLADSVGASRQLALNFIISWTLGTLIGGVLVINFLSQPIVCYGLLYFITICLLYCMCWKKYQTFAMLTALWSFMIVNNAYLEPEIISSLILTAGNSWILGICIYLFVDPILWAKWSYQELPQQFIFTAQQTQAVCQNIFNQINGNLDDEVFFGDQLSDLKAQNQKCYQLLTHAAFERSFIRRNRGDILYLINMNESICHQLRILAQYSHKRFHKHKTNKMQTLLIEVSQCLNRCFEQLVDSYQEQEYIAVETQAAKEKISELQKTTHDLLSNISNSEVIHYIKYDSLCQRLMRLMSKFDSLNYQNLDCFKHSNYRHPHQKQGHEKQPPPKLLSLPNTLFVFKTITAISVALFLQAYYQWHTSVTAITTVFVLSHPLVGQALRKTYHRSVGVFIGVAIGFVAITFLTFYPKTDAALFILVIALIVFSYYAAHFPSEAYIARQAETAFLLLVFPSAVINALLGPVNDRLMGIVLGVVLISTFNKLIPNEKIHDLLNQHLIDAYQGNQRLFKHLNCESAKTLVFEREIEQVKKNQDRLGSLMTIFNEYKKKDQASSQSFERLFELLSNLQISLLATNRAYLEIDPQRRNIEIETKIKSILLRVDESLLQPILKQLSAPNSMVLTNDDELETQRLDLKAYMESTWSKHADAIIVYGNYLSHLFNLFEQLKKIKPMVADKDSKHPLLSP